MFFLFAEVLVLRKGENMKVSLLMNSKMITINLPQTVSGQYWLEDADENENYGRIIGIEAKNGKWFLNSNKYVRVLNSNEAGVDSVCLEENYFYHLLSVKTHSDYYVFTEADTQDRLVFKKFATQSRINITIGRDSKNIVAYKNPFVSSQHATLSFDGIDTWSISDNNSTNGTYINNEKLDGSKDLNPGDVINILGLKIVVGNKFFAVNNPDSNVQVSTQYLVAVKQQEISQTRESTSFASPISSYYRPPRFRRGISTFKFKVDAPPAKEKKDEIPIAFVLGPSMTMGLASIFTAMSAIVNYLSQDPFERNFITILPTIAMALGMLAGTILWPILSKKNEAKRNKRKEALRKEKYIEYLNSCRQEIQNHCNEQRSILIENNPLVSQVATEKGFWEHDLWSREFSDPDFLEIRVGQGNVPMDCEISFPQKSFSLDDDDLKTEVELMATEDYSVNNVPITHSLLYTKATGVVCRNRKTLFEFVNNILLQISMYQSYDEAKIVLISNLQDESGFQFIKWLPHLWNDEKSIRFIASTQEELKELSIEIDRVIESRNNQEDTNKSAVPPHYIIVVTDKELGYKCDFIKKILENNSLGFSVIFAFNELKSLPKECSAVLEIGDNASTIYYKDNLTGEKQVFNAEVLSQEEALSIAKELSNIELDLNKTNFILPSMLTFLDMFGVSKIEHLNALSRWKENNPVSSLKTPVGVDINGDNFILDLHEKFHGPHGLIAGMTGSGKSEFIISYILSLAINYHPNEVAFILIDYKGGGLTGAFESDSYTLPHLAGTITNLDGSSIKRSLVSIQSELRKRQAAFNEARRLANEGTMDIYKYQQLYRNGVVKKPIPHLFIISDEFAELKAQQPEFMEQLISTARIGRSLGVHLILATQKPSGVVDDQIWSNSRFRVCLKVQDKSDSMDMIKRADAAEIAQTGRFYLQVGFNELFELGQSAWSGAPYIPKDSNLDEREIKEISLLDNLGRTVHSVKLGVEEEKDRDNLRQIVEINKYIYNLAKTENTFADQLWLPPIPERIYSEQLISKYNVSKRSLPHLTAVVGELDDPENQKQDILEIDFLKTGNVAVYGATGSGKGQFFISTIYSLLKNYSAEELNVYILDFGSETLKSFIKAPQIADVIISSDSEKLKNFFRLLLKELSNRKKLFSNYGGSYSNYLRLSDKKVPSVVVYINNFAAFSEAYEEYEDLVLQMLREGNRYGIFFVVSATNYNDIKFRVGQNFNKQFVLQLNDNSDYSIILGPTNGLYPAKILGRGLVTDDEDRLFEFQTACAFDDEDLITGINSFCNAIAETAKVFAEPIPVLPEIVNADYFVNSGYELSFKRFVLGIDYNTMKAKEFNFLKNSLLMVAGLDKEELIPFAIQSAQVAAQIENTKVFVFDTVGVSIEQPNVTVVSSDFETAFEQIYKTVVQRHNDYKDYNGKYPLDYDLSNIYCVVIGFGDLLLSFSNEFARKVNELLKRINPAFRVHFVLCDSPLEVSKYSFEDWYKQQLNGDGIWVGDGVNGQFTLNISKRNRDMNREIDNRYGFVVEHGKASFIKLLGEGEELI